MRGRCWYFILDMTYKVARYILNGDEVALK